MPHKRIVPRNERHAKRLEYKYAWESRQKDKPEFKQKRRERQQDWTARNPEYRRAWRAKLRREALALLGGKCSSPDCKWQGGPCADERCLQIDHKNGGGRREFKELGSGDAVYSKVIRENGVGYQLLCANCNWIKRHTNREWPSLKQRVPSMS